MNNDDEKKKTSGNKGKFNQKKDKYVLTPRDRASVNKHGYTVSKDDHKAFEELKHTVEFTKVITPEKVKRLLSAFEFDCTVAEACSYSEININSYYKWILKNPGLYDEINRKKEKPTLLSRMMVLKKIKGDSEKGIEGDAYLAFRYLERKARKEFGPNTANDSGDSTDNIQGGFKNYDIPARLVGSQFADFFRDVENHRFTHFHEPGGRGAGRSSAISLAIISLLMKNKNLNALICRQVATTLRDSVFSQIQWAINELDLLDLFKISHSTLKMEIISTGQQIYFRGLDDP
ncbi:MAG: phage terminase large subunit, partial [Clostridiales Family XIII bacterium]|nr:phage terminase large subunit [Clostridiales Family XIII bacterium]